MTRRVARPPSTCDVPGCSSLIPRGRLMCRPHWYATPHLLREAISLAWKERRIRDWSANCLSARSYHAGIAAPAESKDA
jgi:hypothetical protein